jgi:hypothetical protein
MCNMNMLESQDHWYFLFMSEFIIHTIDCLIIYDEKAPHKVCSTNTWQFLSKQQLGLVQKMTKFCHCCSFSASSWAIFVLFVVLLLVSINCWTVRNDVQHIRSDLRNRIEKNQKYRENIKMLEERKDEMTKEIHMRDERTLELVKRKGEIENKVAGYEKENSKLKFDMESIKQEIVKRNSKQTELQNRLNDLKELFENGRNDEEKYFSFLQKDVQSSELGKSLPKLRDLLRYNRNEIETLLYEFSDKL